MEGELYSALKEEEASESVSSTNFSGEMHFYELVEDTKDGIWLVQVSENSDRSEIIFYHNSIHQLVTLLCICVMFLQHNSVLIGRLQCPLKEVCRPWKMKIEEWGRGSVGERELNVYNQQKQIHFSCWIFIK